jgi:predicted CXXCH cytochrome family protein
MKQTGSLRLILLYIMPVALLTGMLVMAVSLATPAPPKDAAAKKAPKPPRFPLNLFAEAEEGDFANDKTCTNCHRTSVDSFSRSPHAVFMKDPKLPVDKQGCQACHGPGPRHVAHRKPEEGLYENVISFTHAKPAEIAAACLRCHADTITESHWKLAAHARAGVSCTTCHQIHQVDRLGVDEIKHSSPDEKLDGAGSIDRIITTPKSAFPTSQAYENVADPKVMLKADEPTLCGKCHRRQLAEFRHNFHHPVPEGRMVCSDCHNVHSNRDDRKTVRTAKQSCITCHAEVAGPFVYEHDPVSDMTGEGCLECHRPHGSQNPKMLNAFSRGLCTQCHTDKAVNHNPGRTCWDSGCHSAVHGSNHDPLLLQR